ncbi:hypothetical protein [Pseudomonas sp. NUPR-001]|uniref:hypothetical protein n=1 Tax=Pseudomonas sp. NUPR-001 TaxID=3416058 RepID=UPI003F99EFEC
MQLYRDRRYLWPDQDIPPMMMRSPRIAAMICGYDYHEHPTLGDTQFNWHNTGTRIAGLIDRQSNKIAVATEFGDKVQLFTGVGLGVVIQTQALTCVRSATRGAACDWTYP